MYSQGLSHSPVITKEKNSEEQCKPTEAFSCENQGGDSIRCVSTKSSRNPSPVKIQIKLGDSDEECDLVIDAPPEPVTKKRRIENYRGRKSNEELAAVDCAEQSDDGALADLPKRTEEISDKMVILQKNSRSLNTPEALHSGSKGDKIYLHNVNTHTWKAWKERDALALATSVKGNMKKGIWKQGNAETKTVVKTVVHRSASEDCENSRRVTWPVLCTSNSSKDEATTERPYMKRKTEESQRIEENEDDDSLEDTYTDPTYSLSKKESKITLSSPRGESTESSESDDPLEECLRIFQEFEKEKQKEACYQQANRGKVLGTEGNVPEQSTNAAYSAKLAIFEAHNKNEIVSVKASSQQKSHHAEFRQGHREFADAPKNGQAFIARTFEEKQIASGLSASRFKKIEPKGASVTNAMKQSNSAVQPIETRSGQLHSLVAGNASTSMLRGYSIRPFKRATGVPGKVSAQKSSYFPELESKVPFETRQHYVNLFFSECLKICRTKRNALDKAMTEEQSVFDSCSSKVSYLNYAARTLKNLRKHGQCSNSKSSGDAGSKMSEKEKAFTGSALYELLKDYILTEEQLNENNFPRPNPEKRGSAILPKVVKGPVRDALKRMCCRCGIVYAVSSSGEHKCKEECNYHSGRVVEQKVPGGVEKHYSCCERSVGSAGCQIAKLHVHNGRSDKLEGFVKTLSKSLPRDGTFGVYALDCEMCYTTRGLELTRVAVVDAMLRVVYDTFVKPDGKIVDYDQRLSGVTEDDLKNTTTSLQNVQAVLLNLFNEDTILIGHKLEKSFIALKLIHDTVVDTSVVFPHHLGLPNKRTLGSLIAEYLRRIHQEDDVNGHNSKEEATACMELILWKVKEDNKKIKWL